MSAKDAKSNLLHKLAIDKDKFKAFKLVNETTVDLNNASLFMNYFDSRSFDNLL